MRFLQPTGERHRPRERRVALGRRRASAAFALDGAARSRDAERRRRRPAARRACGSRTRRRAPRASTAREALQRSLVSTHVVVRARGGRFVSPLEAAGCENVNTWPVLATRDGRRGARRRDLPARPSAARAREPRRPLRRHRDRGGAAAARPRAAATRERAAIAAQDAAVRAMIARARGRRAGRPACACTACCGRRRRSRGPPRLGERRGDSSTASSYRPGASVVLRLGRPRRPLRPHARRAHRDDRADLRRLRRPRPPRRHDRRATPCRSCCARRAATFLLRRERWSAHDGRDAGAKQILVAAVGNLFLRDDGFGAEVVKRLQAQEQPDGVRVVDFGTGGLDLAYEVMRGYDALVLVDVSRQGGEPGTLYVMEATQDDVDERHRGRRRRSTRTAWTRRPCCASSRRSAAGRARSSSSPASPARSRSWASG